MTDKQSPSTINNNSPRCSPDSLTQGDSRNLRTEPGRNGRDGETVLEKRGRKNRIGNILDLSKH